MSSPQRHRRPQPQRTGPIRDFSTLLRETPASPGGGGEDGGCSAGAAPAASGWESSVARAVERGYSVIEEQIRQGCGLAALRAASRDSDGGESGVSRDGRDIGTMLEILLGCYADIGRRSLELIDTVARGALGDAAGAAREATRQAPAVSPTAVRFSVDLRARRPVEVSLALDPPADPQATLAALTVLPLHAADTDIAPIREVRVTRTPGTQTLCVHVSVGDEQPAGLYSGVVVDAGSHAPCGTLTLRVQA